ncbi:MAG: SAF domain-containing protein [Holosporaceae bacterium]|nr:SAF domain-containing protein [Holosporaceae bacterium]
MRVYDMVVGKTARRDLERGTPLKSEDIEW